MIKHFFRFNYPLNVGLIEAEAEPIGYDAVPFVLNQEYNRMGRDVSHTGSNDAKFTVHQKMHPKIHDFLQRSWEEKGFELDVEQLVEIDGEMRSMGFVSEVNTNNYDTISYILKQSKEQQRFKRNYDVNTDLLSPFDINGNPITPPRLYKVFANAVPVTKISKWNLAQFQFNFERPTINNEFAFSTNSVYFNPVQIQEQYDISASFSGGLVNFNTDSADSFRYLRANQTIENLIIRFDLDVLWKYRPNEITSAGNKAGSLSLYVRWGQTLDTSQGFQPIYYIGSDGNTDANVQMPSVIETVIPKLNETDIVWIYWRVGSLNASVNRIVFNSAKITATATQVADSTVVNCIRLIDAMRYAVLSSAGLNINAPKFDVSGKYYPIMITSDALMRYIFDKPFNISVKNIVDDGLPFCNGDYQLLPNNTVYFGATRKDFYRNVEIGTYLTPDSDWLLSNFDMVLEDYNQTYNNRAWVNKIQLKFSKYASLKEVPVDGSYGVIHGETEKITPNNNADNVIDVQIGWVFDPYYFEEARVKTFEITKDTATQDNDTVFALDTAELPQGTTRRVTKTLRHEDLNGVLTLLNTGNFSFIQLGITINTTFVINDTVNAGIYNVTNVQDTSIKLVRTVPGAIGFLAEANTSFTYTIDPSVVLQTRTNQGITNIEGIDNGNRFGNLAYTTDRILREAYADNIATACINHSDGLVRTTTYKNNPGAQTTIDGITIKEGDNFIGYDGVNQPSISDRLCTVTMIMKYSQLVELYSKAQTERGYIRSIQPNGYPVKFYPKELSAQSITKDPENGNDYIMVVTGTGEEKYISYYMTILSDGVNPIIINGDIITVSITFKVIKGKIHIMDSVGQLLYVPVPYNRVSINNSTAFNSIAELVDALNYVR